MPDGVKQTAQVGAAAIWRAVAPLARTAALKPLARPEAATLAKPDDLQTSKKPLTGKVAAVVDTLRDGITLPVQIQEQTGNACGTTSLSMVLKYFRVPAAAADVKAIDRAIRPSSRDAKIDSFTAPIDIVRYAQRQGMRATLHNHSTSKDLEAMLAQGVPPMILYDWDAPTGKGLHYVVVSGQREQNGQREWQLHDPSGYAWYIDDAELQRRWSNLHVAGVEVPYDRVMIAISPRQGTVQTPYGTTKPAAEVRLPAHNSSVAVDMAASVATWGIGVGADAYDAGRWVAGKAQAGAAVVSRGWGQLTQSVSGLLR
jgi:hypothetical protein